MEERFLRFSLFSRYPGLVHGISNRSYGDMRFSNNNQEEVRKNRHHFFNQLEIDANEVVVPGQIHSTNIAIVSEKEKGRGAMEPDTKIADTDALITTRKGVYLMIQTADCLPILLYEPATEMVAAIHGGWRGLLAQIILRTIDKMIELGANSENIIACVGPGICQKHFVVRNDVLKHFLVSHPGATMVRNKDGYVDLKKIALIDLKKAGIHASNIEVSKFCTVCDNGLFGSFRKEGSGAPEIASIIGMRK